MLQELANLRVYLDLGTRQSNIIGNEEVSHVAYQLC